MSYMLDIDVCIYLLTDRAPEKRAHILSRQPDPPLLLSAVTVQADANEVRVCHEITVTNRTLTYPLFRQGLPESRLQGRTDSTHPCELDAGNPCRHDDYLCTGYFDTTPYIDMCSGARIRRIGPLRPKCEVRT